MDELHDLTIKKIRIDTYKEHKDFFTNGIKKGYLRWYCIAVCFSAENLLGAYFTKHEIGVSVEFVDSIVANHKRLPKDVRAAFRRLWQIRDISLYTATTVTEKSADEAKRNFEKIESNVAGLLSA